MCITVRNTLEKIFQASVLLSVVPKIQDHEITSDACASAMLVLSKARVASVFCHGVDRLPVWRRTSGGAAEAKKFVEQNYSSTRQLPDVYWAVFKELSEYVSVTPPVESPRPMKQMKLEDIGVNREQSQSSAGLHALALCESNLIKVLQMVHSCNNIVWHHATYPRASTIGHFGSSSSMQRAKQEAASSSTGTKFEIISVT